MTNRAGHRHCDHKGMSQFYLDGLSDGIDQSPLGEDVRNHLFDPTPVHMHVDRHLQEEGWGG